MSHHKVVMVDYVEFSSPGKVRSGDNRVVEAPGKGNVLVNVKVGGCYEPVQLLNVLYVPDLAKNLLSTSVIAKRGYYIAVLSWMMNNDVLDVYETTEVCQNTSAALTEQMEYLWHQIWLLEVIER